MEIRARAVPGLARHVGAARNPAGLPRYRDRLSVARTQAQAHRGGLQWLAKLRQRGKLAQVDRRDYPVAPVAPHQLLRLQAQQRGADRRAGALEAAFQPAFGQPFARANVQRENHLTKLVVRSGASVTWAWVCRDTQFGIPRWYP